MATLDLPDDVRLALAKARDRLNLDPFASPLEVIQKLAALGQSVSVDLPQTKADTALPPVQPSPQGHRATKHKETWPPSKMWIIDGKSVEHGSTQADQFGNALRALAQANPQFLRKFSAYCESQAGDNGRMWVSENRDRLYPGNAKLTMSQSREVPGNPGWWFGTNYSREKKREIIKAACRIGGVSFKEVSSHRVADEGKPAPNVSAEPSHTVEGHRDFYIKCWLRAFYSQGGVLDRQRGVENLVFNQIKPHLTQH
ncbi:MAG TPA: hypothetical protein VMB73_29665, partial [Acetobacteraceae bacterium]|nr:hypothetical protein [Acetobacteraceae bacterium]